MSSSTLIGEETEAQSQGEPELGFEPRPSKVEILAPFHDAILSVYSCWEGSVTVKRKEEVKRGGMRALQPTPGGGKVLWPAEPPGKGRGHVGER